MGDVGGGGEMGWDGMGYIDRFCWVVCGKMGCICEGGMMMLGGWMNVVYRTQIGGCKS